MNDRNGQTEKMPDASMDGNLEGLPEIVAQIVETMQLGQIGSLVLSKGDFHLELKTTAASPATVQTQMSVPAEEGPDATKSAADDGTHVITSPMIGTFYVAPAPGEPPFVRPGDTVSQGDTIGIVEAMKIMNEIAADRAGTVQEVIAENGETVEYGSPLVRLQAHS